MTLIKMQTLNNSNSEFETTGAFLLFWDLKWNKFPDIYLKNSASEKSLRYCKKQTYRLER